MEVNQGQKTAIVFDGRYFDHEIDRPSPENSGRLRALYRKLQDDGYDRRFLPVSPRDASWDDILAVHSRFYLDQIREHALNADPYSYDRDTYLMERSLYTARLAVGGCLELADRIMDQTVSAGFALIRPPGHHAEAGRGMGFCILNNVAITAEYLRRRYGLERILIVDFDVHHGNGTQNIFYDTDQVLVWSIHQQNIFPFSGAPEEIGQEQGLGYTINLPVYDGFGDQEYIHLAGRVLTAVAEQYLPQFILVSAGYDAHEQDSMSRIQVTTDWFGLMTTFLRGLAQDCCDHRLLMVLEGGYDPASLTASVLATLDALDTETIDRVGIPPSERGARVLAGHPLRRFWTL